ncbi:MAG: dihydrofolate reductase family protein [Anaerolineaceae bacterium]|nr:dihydrofolate reductase family protein [Anaerolineaceae bacterium]
MSKVVLGMTMSLDGFINDRYGSVDRLFSDLVLGDVQHESIQNNAIMQDALQNTGEVVMGKNTFLMGGDPDYYADGYEFQVPIFVLTSHPPVKKPKENENLTFTFVTEGIEAAIALAKPAAGGRDVVVLGGASTANQALHSGLVDEIQVDIMPVLLGGGMRFFEKFDSDVIELQKIEIVETPIRTTLKFRVVKRNHVP